VKKVILLIFIVVVLGIGGTGGYFYLNKDKIAAGKIETIFAQNTGMETTVEGATFDMRTGRLHVDRIQITNPDGYGQKKMAVLTDFEVELDFQKYWKDKQILIHNLSVRVDEVHVVRRADGNVNLREVTVLKPDYFKTEIPPQSRQNPDFLIERVELKYGRVSLREEVKGGAPQELSKDLTGRQDVFGYVIHPSILFQLPALKVLFELKRGSMGIPRTEIQQRAVKLTGQT